jgi:hypothetical protein
MVEDMYSAANATPAGTNDPMDVACDDCRAQPGEPCHVDCSSRWDNDPDFTTWCPETDTTVAECAVAYGHCHAA